MDRALRFATRQSSALGDHHAPTNMRVRSDEVTTMPEQQTERAVVQIRPAVLSRIDAAKYLGIGPTKFDELRKADAFRTFNLCGRVVFKVDDLDAYLETVFAEPPRKASRGKAARS
jgi:hypothetical protein